MTFNKEVPGQLRAMYQIHLHSLQDECDQNLTFY